MDLISPILGFFEKERDWLGLLIEPNLVDFNKMVNYPRNRSFKENCVISDIEEDVIFLSIEGPCSVLSGIKKFYNPKHLDRINRELNMYKGYPKGHEFYSYSEEIKMRRLD